MHQVPLHVRALLLLLLPVLLHHEELPDQTHQEAPPRGVSGPLRLRRPHRAAAAGGEGAEEIRVPPLHVALR